MTEPPPSWSSPTGDGAPPPPPFPMPAQPSPYGYGYGYAAAQPGVIPLRPLALGELLDGSIKVIRRYPKPTLGLSAAITAVVTLLNVIGVLILDQDVADLGEDDEITGEQIAGAFATFGPAQLLSFFAGLILTGALIAVVGQAVQGKEAPLEEVWATVRPRIWALLGLALLTFLIVVAPVAVGIMVAVVLGIALGGAGVAIGVLLALGGLGLTVYLYIRLSLAPAALVLEKTQILPALRRSGVLVRGSWWRILGILLLTGLITSIISAIIGSILVVPVAITMGDDGSGFLVANQIAVGLASVILAPFTSGVRALLYVDRRMRAEGLDVALQAAVAEGPAG